jgi:hypothetical protein
LLVWVRFQAERRRMQWINKMAMNLACSATAAIPYRPA